MNIGGSFLLILDNLRINVLYLLAVLVVVAPVYVCAEESVTKLEETSGATNICRPIVEPVSSLVLGESVMFRWTCSGARHDGEGYYIVVIRPVGTYVLLRVPRNRNFFEFTPDMEGHWRCIVINTDPDRTQPDLESEPVYFEVLRSIKP
jgi:hypothetical protein